jgi:hypothetical protein
VCQRTVWTEHTVVGRWNMRCRSTDYPPSSPVRLTMSMKWLHTGPRPVKIGGTQYAPTIRDAGRRRLSSGKVLSVGTVFKLDPIGTNDLISILAFTVALLGGIFAYRQLRISVRTEQARFLLDLDESFERDREIRRTLERIKRDAATPATKQRSLNPDEKHQVKAYMARFERVNVLLDQRLLRGDVVRRLYEARYSTLRENDYVAALLKRKPGKWRDFLALAKKLDFGCGESGGGTPSPRSSDEDVDDLES